MMIEIWEMSDGQTWQIEYSSPGYRVKVVSLLENDETQRIGEFDNEASLVMWAMRTLQASVVSKIRLEDNSKTVVHNIFDHGDEDGET
jgi:hypothetical protein